MPIWKGKISEIKEIQTKTGKDMYFATLVEETENTIGTFSDLGKPENKKGEQIEVEVEKKGEYFNKVRKGKQVTATQLGMKELVEILKKPKLYISCSKTIQEAEFEPFKATASIEFPAKANPETLKNMMDITMEQVDKTIKERLDKLKPKPETQKAETQKPETINTEETQEPEPDDLLG